MHVMRFWRRSRKNEQPPRMAAAYNERSVQARSQEGEGPAEEESESESTFQAIKKMVQLDKRA